MTVFHVSRAVPCNEHRAAPLGSCAGAQEIGLAIANMVGADSATARVFMKASGRRDFAMGKGEPSGPSSVSSMRVTPIPRMCCGSRVSLI